MENEKPEQIIEVKDTKTLSADEKPVKNCKLRLLTQKVCGFFAKLFKKTKQFVVKAYKVTKQFVVKAYKVTKQFLIKAFSSIKLFLIKAFKRVKEFLVKTYKATKQFLAKIFNKTKACIKNLINKFSALTAKTKMLITGVIVLTLALSIILSSIMVVRANNLSSYNLLLDANNYSQEFVLEDEFLTSTFVDAELLEDTNNNYVLYKAMKNNYAYYLPHLKEAKNTNEQFRTSLNNDLQELSDIMKMINLHYGMLSIQVENEFENEQLINILHEQLNQKLEEYIILSVSLLPQLENYINMYAAENITNKLQVYLTKLQFHYGVSIINKAGLGGNIEANLTDLNSIIQKFEAFSGQSSSTYKNAFIAAYENYSAYDYYAASDKVGFRLSLSGTNATYANAFYNFLTQASYN